jgi:hypothetical protein
MDDVKPSLKEKLELRITLCRLDAVFEACNKLPEAAKEVLYEEMQKRVLEHARQSRAELPALAEIQPYEFSERCLELAAAAPNDKVRNALLMIAHACETEAEGIAASPDATQAE